MDIKSLKRILGNRKMLAAINRAPDDMIVHLCEKGLAIVTPDRVPNDWHAL